MGKKWMKRAAALFTALLLTVANCGLASAADIDLTAEGSITVTLHDSSGEAVSGGSLTLYQVADMVTGDSGLSYVCTDEFAGNGYDFSDLSSDSLAAEIAADAEGVSGTSKELDENGSVTFSGLALGLYLLVQNEAPEGYEAISPFLVTVPLSTDDGWDYSVDASPKAETYAGTTEVTVKKVWNDGESKKKQTRPESVTIELYRGDEKVDSVILNSDNDWMYTWTELKYSDDYSVSEVTVKGWKATYTKDGNVYTVTNTSTLPQTGQLNWPVPLLAACGLLLFGLGWGLKRSGSKNEK